jgi:uncharacterized protein YndB with AHSA1/START domain
VATRDALTLEMTRVLPAGRTLVFKFFTDPKQLARWWGPQGFSTPNLQFDPRVGESFRIEMQPPESDAFHLTGEFREVDPPTRLPYTLKWEEPDPDDVETLVASPSGISASPRKSASTQGRSSPRLALRFTETAGRTASSTSSTSCWLRRHSSPPSRSGGVGAPATTTGRDQQDRELALAMTSRA